MLVMVPKRTTENFSTFPSVENPKSSAVSFGRLIAKTQEQRLATRDFADGFGYKEHPEKMIQNNMRPDIDLNSPAPVEEDIQMSATVGGNTAVELTTPQVQPASEIHPEQCWQLIFKKYLESQTAAAGGLSRGDGLTIREPKEDKNEKMVNVKFPRQGEDEAGKAVVPQAPPQVPQPKELILTCPICVGKMVEETSTKCGHIFCKSCIAAALASQRKCPTCRRKLRVTETFRIYLPIASE